MLGDDLRPINNSKEKRPRSVSDVLDLHVFHAKRTFQKSRSLSIGYEEVFDDTQPKFELSSRSNKLSRSAESLDVKGEKELGRSFHQTYSSSKDQVDHIKDSANEEWMINNSCVAPSNTKTNHVVTNGDIHDPLLKSGDCMALTNHVADPKSTANHNSYCIPSIDHNLDDITDLKSDSSSTANQKSDIVRATNQTSEGNLSTNQKTSTISVIEQSQTTEVIIERQSSSSLRPEIFSMKSRESEYDSFTSEPLSVPFQRAITVDATSTGFDENGSNEPLDGADEVKVTTEVTSVTVHTLVEQHTTNSESVDSSTADAPAADTLVEDEHSVNGYAECKRAANGHSADGHEADEHAADRHAADRDAADRDAVNDHAAGETAAEGSAADRDAADGNVADEHSAENHVVSDEVGE